MLKISLLPSMGKNNSQTSEMLYSEGNMPPSLPTILQLELYIPLENIANIHFGRNVLAMEELIFQNSISSSMKIYYI
jgi:hypothetical protein